MVLALFLRKGDLPTSPARAITRVVFLVYRPCPVSVISVLKDGEILSNGAWQHWNSKRWVEEMWSSGFIRTAEPILFLNLRTLLQAHTLPPALHTVHHEEVRRVEQIVNLGHERNAPLVDSFRSRSTRSCTPGVGERRSSTQSHSLDTRHYLRDRQLRKA
jgi:hypothetical protein